MIFVTGPLFAGKKEYVCQALGWSEEDLPTKAAWDVQDLAAQAEDLEALADDLSAQYPVLIATELLAELRHAVGFGKARRARAEFQIARRMAAVWRARFRLS